MQQHLHQDWLTLSFLPGLGCTLIHRLVEEFGSPAQVLAVTAGQLNRVEGVGKKLVQLFGSRSRIDQARQRAILVLQSLPGHGVVLVSLDDPEYPEFLRAIDDPPVLLYCRGNVACLGRPAVAIIGSRAATVYGKRVALELARQLSDRGICVVSGMALGIDGEAHTGALPGSGATIGVLGCGIDVIYPRQHEDLFDEMHADGLLVSEYPFGARPEGFHFPERNRIISGLALGVVVVEASLKSGSLITARLALEQGREVFAVPGRIDSMKSQGTHRLLQQGAKLVHSVDDILDELPLSRMALDSAVVDVEVLSLPPVSDEEQHLLGFLDVYPVSIDELVRQSGHGAEEVFDLLLRLELKGMIRQLPGQQYERLVSN